MRCHLSFHSAAVLLLLFASVSLSFGQGLEGELMVRPSLTSLRGNDFVKDNLDPTVNIGFGVGVNFLLSESNLITVALLYETKGGRAEHSVELRDPNNQSMGKFKGKFESNFQYLLVPVQYGYRFGSDLRFEAAAGVYGAVLLQQKSESKIGNVKEVDDQTDLYKTFDFGISLSMSAYIPMNESVSLKLGLSDNLGLMNVSDVDVAERGIKHNSFALCVGVNFKL